ncbi:hypothetical protein [Streptomyces sp. NPDC055992]|uniref:hypothetical protein n=1 Tax=Streptomyces sp. NPDC055992 TaxID=3345673 RepID=UPI0035DE7599
MEPAEGGNGLFELGVGNCPAGREHIDSRRHARQNAVLLLVGDLAMKDRCEELGGGVGSLVQLRVQGVDVASRLSDQPADDVAGVSRTKVLGQVPGIVDGQRLGDQVRAGPLGGVVRVRGHFTDSIRAAPAGADRGGQVVRSAVGPEMVARLVTG